MLKAAIIGCGPRAMDEGCGHVKGIVTNRNLKLSALVDPDSERLKKYTQQYSVPGWSDAKEYFKNEVPDIVTIATREKPRYALTLEAIEAGVKGIVLEKPMAANILEARDMVRRAKEKGVVMVLSQQMRFSDEFIIEREMLNKGEIGKPYFVRASCFGQLMEQGPHMVDMVQYLLNDPEVDWVMGQVADLKEGLETVHPAPAFVVGYIAFKNGIRAELECGRRFQRAIELPDETWTQKRVQVLGTEGVLDAVVMHWCKIMNKKSRGWKVLYEGDKGWNDATNKLYQELFEVLTKGGVHRNNAEASLRGFEIIHGIYQSAVIGDRVTIPLPDGIEPLGEIMKRLK